MKRTLAIMLTALMLFSALPFASAQAAPAAQDGLDFTVRCPVSYAYAGEIVLWYVDSIQGSTGGTIQYAFDVYKNGRLLDGGEYHRISERYYKLPSPGTYKVKVSVRVDGAVYSKFSDDLPVYANPIKPIKVEPLGATSLMISWNKVPGATYYVFRNTTPDLNDANWTLVKQTTGTSFSNTYLKAGTRYFYVVAYPREEEAVTYLSPAVSGVPMAKTAIKSITSPAKGQVKLVWSKAAGASGYQVLMATSPNGTYKSVRTLNGTTVTFSGMKSGSTFYFKVRPYRRVYTTTCWGQYSPQRAVKVK